jgi:hypothetical protein
MDINNKIAEIIFSNSSHFIAQCYQLNNAPQLGSLVKIRLGDKVEIYGVIYLVETHGMEPGRRVFIRGEKLGREDEIYKINPQLEKLLVTDISVLVLGYSENGNVYHFLPPQPSPIHGFVYVCTDKEVIDFTGSFNYLSLIAEAKINISIDEVIAAFLRYASSYHKNPKDFLVKAGKELVWIYGSDVRRLNSLLKRLAYAD